MTIESALESAIVYEKKVRDVYREAETKSADDIGRRVFSLLAEEEANHVSYLEHRLKHWIEKKALSANDLKTALSQASSNAGDVEQLHRVLSDDVRTGEIALLENVREVERETIEFYERMVNELPEGGKAFFKRFLEIEDGHFNLVQYEIDSLTNSGFWMGVQEFDMEAIG